MSDIAPTPSGSTHRWEIPVTRWEEIKEIIRDRLERSARLRAPIAYSNLISGLPFAAPNSHALAEMLGEISRESLARGEPMLSAVAVYISGERVGEAAEGLVRAAKWLHWLPENASEEEGRIFAELEKERCFDHWGPRRQRRSRG